jgi:hypothetical protein
LGAWGTAIFADDTASDIRDEWRAAILDGLSAEDATQRLLESFDEYLEDAETEKLFWMALAAAEMETGRLLPEVRDRALAIIDAGGDVDRWREGGDASLARQRERVLERLAAKLRGPQPKPKRLRRPVALSVPLEVGDVVRVRAQREGRTRRWSLSSATAKASRRANSTRSLHRWRGRAANSRSAIASRACLSSPTPWRQISRC